MLIKIKNLFTRSCVLFTASVFLLYCIGYAVIGDEITPSLSVIAILFVTCLILCLINGILHAKTLPMIFRILIHYAAVLTSAFLFFAFVGNIVSTTVESLVMLALVTLIYTAVALIFSLIGSKSKNKSAEYTPMFKK